MKVCWLIIFINKILHLTSQNQTGKAKIKKANKIKLKRWRGGSESNPISLPLSVGVGISSTWAPPYPDRIEMIKIPYLTALTTYFSYGLLFAFGQLRDFFRKIVDWWSLNRLEVRAFHLLRWNSTYLSSGSWWCIVFWNGRAMRRSVWGLRISTFVGCI